MDARARNTEFMRAELDALKALLDWREGSNSGDEELRLEPQELHAALDHIACIGDALTIQDLL